jgi:glycogen operon protein
MTSLTPAARPGDASKLGATPHSGGVNFAVASAVAEEVTLCLFDAGGQEPQETQVRLDDYDAGVWHGFVPGIGPGQAYGYRVTGPFDPRNGLRCNPRKLLLDPYARAFTGRVTYGPELLGHDPRDPDRPSSADSKGSVPLSLVTDPGYDWEGDTQLSRPYADTVLYEVHVKGFTMRHPDIPPAIRGTYAGLAHDAAIGHLLDLGVTAVELLPVHQYVPEQFLLDRGLTNYWGYNTIGFFAPHQGYSAAARSGRQPGQVSEFKDMVKALHGAGIEVILDVVYNHTAEGNHNGPTLSFRGLDNREYYRLVAGDERHYYDTTGTGNSLNTGNPYTLRMIMDSLRYWMSEMHVDGFRFDLAATLGREADNVFDQMSAFFQLIVQDPVVSQAKLIAEPWDVGQADSYDLGRFPAQWREWNGRYRDCMRDFWRGADVGVAEFATRFSGSSDLYGRARRRPTASVNLITVHDGFTLRDLVSYNRKHNEPNGEGNRDGSDDNRSWNCGAEGPTDDSEVNALRARQSRAMLTTLLLSFGMPLLLGGDEMGRTQRGNNNAYCQDNEISWFDWDAADMGLRGYTARLIALRREHPVFRRQKYLTGAEAAELGWYSPAGTPMTGQQWADKTAHAVAVYLDGADEPDEAPDGTLMVDDDFLVLVNAWWGPVTFTVPEVRPTAQSWFTELDSYDPAVPAVQEPRHAGDQLVVRPRSLTVLRASQDLSRTHAAVSNRPAVFRARGRPLTQGDRGEDPREQHQAGRHIQRQVHAVTERGVGGPDHLADDRAVGGVVADVRANHLPGLDELEDERLVANRNAELLKMNREARVDLGEDQRAQDRDASDRADLPAGVGGPGRHA